MAERRKNDCWTMMACILLFALGTACDGKPTMHAAEGQVLVVRVESPSPEEPGAEHCNQGGKDCRPLAAQQKIPASGVVRTFAGGSVSLDFGKGRRIDLDSLSQVELTDRHTKLIGGDFTVDSVPLIEKEDVSPLVIEASGFKLNGKAHTPTRLAFSIQESETIATVHLGELEGVLLDGKPPIVGQSIRLTNAQAFRTSQVGGELPSLEAVLPERVYADGLGVSEQEPRGLGMMTARLPNSDQVQKGVDLRRHHVRVAIVDGFARTEVEEEFENTTPHVLEGRYAFAVPPGATISRLALWVDDRLMEGEVLERERAGQIYTSIVDRPVPRDPALLEWMTGGALSLRVFPILPRKTRKVILAYNQALSTEGGILRYVYPLSLGDGKETRIKDFSLTVHLKDRRARTERIGIDGYDAQQGREGDWQTVSLLRKDFVPRRDFVLSLSRVSGRDAELSAFSARPAHSVDRHYGEANLPVLPSDNNVPADVAARGHFALRLTADLPPGTPRPPQPKLHRAIILDVSHSQSKRSIVAQGALALSMVRGLSADEEFVLLACDSACTSLASTTFAQSERTFSGRLERVQHWLEGLRSGGSSDVSGALMAAFGHLSRLGAERPGHLGQLVLLHDGNVSSGELSAAAIRDRVLPLLRTTELDLRLVGVGRTVDHELLTELAVGLDAPVDFLEGDGFASRMFEVTIGLRKPVIRRVELRLPEQFRASRSLGHAALRLGQELVLTGELLSTEGLSSAAVSIVGDLQGAKYALRSAIARDTSLINENPLIVRLWARDRIEELSGQVQDERTRREVIALSTRFRTMSRYTSFLVLENEKMYADFGIDRTSRTSNDQVDGDFLNLPEREAKAAMHRQGGSLESQLLEDSPQGAFPAESRAPARPPGAAPKADAPFSGPTLEARGPAALGGDRAQASSGAGAHALRERKASSRQEKPTAATPPNSASPDSEVNASEARWDDGLEGGRDEEPVARSPKKKMHVPRSPTSHLRITQADDAWRSWGESQREELLAKLTRNPESRAIHQEVILGLLKLGRFSEARRSAAQYFEIDPDNSDAQLLLAYAGAVDGDHELSRKMLDVRTESAPRSAPMHLQAARAFLAVRDDVRACAHLRSYAAIEKGAVAEGLANACWQAMMLPSASPISAQGLPQTSGHLEVEVECHPSVAAEDCPSPLVVTPAGQVLSPWTPGEGKTSRRAVTAVKIRGGDYFVLVTGGSPSSHGRVLVRGRSVSKSLPFRQGSQHTVARVQASYW